MNNYLVMNLDEIDLIGFQKIRFSG